MQQRREGHGYGMKVGRDASVIPMILYLYEASTPGVYFGFSFKIMKYSWQERMGR